MAQGALEFGTSPVLAITARRAAALGLAPMFAAVPEPGEANGVVLLSLAEGVRVDELLALIDPTQALRQAGSVVSEIVAGKTSDLFADNGAFGSAMALARAARLLPALVGFRLAPADAGRIAREQGLSLVRDGVTGSAGLSRVSSAEVPLLGAEQARIVAFRPADGGDEHLAIIVGQVDPAVPTLVRVHSACLTGDLLGSLRCDCGDQLRGAIAEMGRRGSGVLLYLAQEGRGIGLVNKLRAYQLQDAGADTLDANEALGFDADERDFAPAAEMLRQLAIATVRLMTNNPAKILALEANGIRVVERVGHSFAANDHNHRYLETKARRSGHLL